MRPCIWVPPAANMGTMNIYRLLFYVQKLLLLQLLSSDCYSGAWTREGANNLRQCTDLHQLQRYAAAHTLAPAPTYLTHTAPGDATIKLPKRAGGRSAPHVPRRTIAIWPLTAARASRTTKSILGIPMSVVMMDTGTPSNSPAGKQVSRTGVEQSVQ